MTQHRQTVANTALNNEATGSNRRKTKSKGARHHEKAIIMVGTMVYDRSFFSQLHGFPFAPVRFLMVLRVLLLFCYDKSLFILNHREILITILVHIK